MTKKEIESIKKLALSENARKGGKALFKKIGSKGMSERSRIYWKPKEDEQRTSKKSEVKEEMDM